MTAVVPRRPITTKKVPVSRQDARGAPFFDNHPTIQKAMKLGVAKADIKKPATPHTLRHSWATSMLEAGLGPANEHASFVTKMIKYLAR